MATVKELKEAGKLDEALEMAKGLYESEPDNVYYRSGLAWVYDAYCKRAAETGDVQVFADAFAEIERLGMTGDNVMSKALCWRFLTLTRNIGQGEKNEPVGRLISSMIRQLQVEKPSKEYSLLLKAMLKLKEFTLFKDFCDWWDFGNFMPEDYADEVLPNGRKLMSVAEQAYIAYSKILLNEGNIVEIKEFASQLQDIVECYPKMTYPGYYCARLLLRSGGGSEALDVLLPFAQKKKSEFWIWQLMAEIQTDYTKRLACLMRAVSCRTEEKFLVKVRQIFASTLIDGKHYAEAKLQIAKLVTCLSGNGNKVPTAVQNWMAEPWYASIQPASASPLCVDYMSITDSLLYGNLDEVLAVVSFVNKDKSIANVVYGREKTGFFKYARLLRKVRVGDVLDLRFDMKNAAGSNNRLNVAVATLHKGKVKDSDFYKRVGGHVRSNSKGTFFSIDFQGGSAYIPMQLMKEHKLSVGDNVVATAIYDYNKKRGEWGWRCISVHPAQKAEM